MSDIEPRVICTVCIPTFKRPEQLAALLVGLENQTFPDSEAPLWDILIIDNDPAQTAGPVFESFQKTATHHLHYCAEKIIGLCHGRNQAIAFTCQHADFLCFIDDDEVPIPTWLDALLHMQREKNADCIYGPVLAKLPETAPQWLRQGGYLNSPVFEDGEEVPWAGTGNVLLSTRFLEKSALTFDVRFNQTGGEDAHFFYIAQKKHGLRIFGAAKAIAYEDVLPERMTLKWLIRRRFRVGNSVVLSERDDTHLRPIRFFKSLAWILSGLVTWPAALWNGRVATVNSLLKIAFGLGMLSGLGGMFYQEYAETKAVHAKKVR